MKAVYRLPAVKFDGTGDSAMEIAEFSDGAEVTLKYERYPDDTVTLRLKPTVDYVDWVYIELLPGDVLVRDGAGQRLKKLEAKWLDSYTYITIEEDEE